MASSFLERSEAELTPEARFPADLSNGAVAVGSLGRVHGVLGFRFDLQDILNLRSVLRYILSLGL